MLNSYLYDDFGLQFTISANSNLAHWGHESSEKVIGIHSPGIQSIAQCFYRVSFEIFCVFMPLDVVMMLIAMEVVRNEYLFCGL